MKPQVNPDVLAKLISEVVKLNDVECERLTYMAKGAALVSSHSAAATRAPTRRKNARTA